MNKLKKLLKDPDVLLTIIIGMGIWFIGWLMTQI